jgi:hypothetical protein
MIPLLPDWMYQAIEESFTCQFTSVTERGIPVALPVVLSHFDPDMGTLVVSSPLTMKRVGNARRHPEVAILFSPVGMGQGEPAHVVLVQGRAGPRWTKAIQRTDGNAISLAGRAAILPRARTL